MACLNCGCLMTSFLSLHLTPCYPWLLIITLSCVLYFYISGIPDIMVLFVNNDMKYIGANSITQTTLFRFKTFHLQLEAIPKTKHTSGGE